MYFTLFQLAGLAIVGWIPLIFFPRWRGSRWLAESAFFPIYIAVLYAFGVGALLMQFGAGFIADFGTAEGVARLLARQEIAWVAWLHILAFDQVVGLWIYRENMRHRYVPMPVQSALLFLTLMFGPLGALFFASALGIMTLSVALASRAFEMGTTGRRGLLVLAARWAGASMLIGFLAGMWLSANQGRFVSPAGNLLPLHAAGFHGVQAVPLVALMLAWSTVPVDAARRWVHVAGAAWAAACLAIWWRTALGRPVTDVAGFGMLIVILLGVWTLTALRGLVAWRSGPAEAGHYAR